MSDDWVCNWSKQQRWAEAVRRAAGPVGEWTAVIEVVLQYDPNQGNYSFRGYNAREEMLFAYNTFAVATRGAQIEVTRVLAKAGYVGANRWADDRPPDAYINQPVGFRPDAFIRKFRVRV